MSKAKVRCADCVYARADKSASDKRWTAYACGNAASEYHKALLNVTPSGEKLGKVTWPGCTSGRRAST